uniref:cyclin-dependent kinase n=1 Tax=Timema californicum TaxID=61474 RepID=A0A7R9P7H6_TIMCA|nr:unnamed protein product [Timema californicum]
MASILPEKCGTVRLRVAGPLLTYSSSMTSLVLTDSSQLTSDSQHLDEFLRILINSPSYCYTGAGDHGCEQAAIDNQPPPTDITACESRRDPILRSFLDTQTVGGYELLRAHYKLLSERGVRAHTRDDAEHWLRRLDVMHALAHDDKRLDQPAGGGMPGQAPTVLPDASSLFREHGNYEELGLIGNGAYGTVYKAKDLSNNGMIVALKKVRVPLTDDGVPMSTLREISLLKQLDTYDHPNIVRDCTRKDHDVIPCPLGMLVETVIGRPAMSFLSSGNVGRDCTRKDHGCLPCPLGMLVETVLGRTTMSPLSSGNVGRDCTRKDHDVSLVLWECW